MARLSMLQDTWNSWNACVTNLSIRCLGGRSSSSTTMQDLVQDRPHVLRQMKEWLIVQHISLLKQPAYTRQTQILWIDLSSETTKFIGETNIFPIHRRSMKVFLIANFWAPDKLGGELSRAFAKNDWCWWWLRSYMWRKFVFSCLFVFVLSFPTCSSVPPVSILVHTPRLIYLYL